MTPIGIEELQFLVLTDEHRSLLPTFKCKNNELRGFLIENALDSQRDKTASTRLVIYNGRLVGYFTLVTDVIKKKEIVDGDGEPTFQYSNYPALKIARLATHQDYENRHIGRSMLKKIYTIWIEFSHYIGCRIITVDAKPEAVGFYEKFAFHKALIGIRKLQKRDTVPLYIDIRKELEHLGYDHSLTEYEEIGRAERN
ncbi:GNAT family N-acetyltransferase [Methanoregula sp.]|uniref:GNAT family N-acetyltransferase n=1 Tax=Methanoregula sp. TaxID=2052170 RepID=UPI003BB109F1